MSLTPYELSLTATLSLMIFIGLMMFYGPHPQLKVRDKYKHSCKCMGCAILLLAVDYCIQLFVNPRFSGYRTWAIYLNLSTYMAVVPLFYCALIQLLDNRFTLTFNKVKVSHIVLCIACPVFMALAMFAHPEKQYTVLIVYALIFCAYSSGMGGLLYVRYRRLIRMIDNTQSEDMRPYVRWMSFLTLIIVVYGPLCGILAFLPNKFTFIGVLTSMPLYIYIYISYNNYLLFDEKVSHVEPEMPGQENDDAEEFSDEVILSEYYKMRDESMRQQVERWIADKGFAEQGLTLASLAAELNTNRTYLAGYLKRAQTKPFREWINDMRIEYAKYLMTESPFMTMAEVAERSGYSTLSHFTTTFSRSVGVSPSKWNKLNNSRES